MPTRIGHFSVVVLTNSCSAQGQERYANLGPLSSHTRFSDGEPIRTRRWKLQAIYEIVRDGKLLAEV